MVNLKLIKVRIRGSTLKVRISNAYLKCRTGYFSDIISLFYTFSKNSPS